MTFKTNQLELIRNSGMSKEDLPKKTTLNIERPVYQLEELNVMSTYDYVPPTFSQSVKQKFSSCRTKSCLLQTIPVLKWLPRYNYKKNLLSDILSGCTIAIMHIPQGMAYALLGNLPPIVGIYMGFFPVMVYFIFGTSRHVSMGTFAVVCLMTGKTVSNYSYEEHSPNSTIFNVNDTEHRLYTKMEVATTVTFTVAVMQMVMYVLRLGIVTALLSETLVSAFTCASACHVVCSQVKDLFGLALQRRKGMFSIIYTLYDAGSMLPKTNTVAVAISLIYIMVMLLNNMLLKPWLAKRTKIPMPIELLAIVTGTLISYLLRLNEKYAVNIVGTVPTGLPKPDIPVFSLIPTIALDAFVITMVSYTITMSMALMFAQKLHYEIDANQELLALSCSNCVGSFFSCMPVTASLSRSLIQQTVGGVTQIASVVSCSILLVVLLWIGPIFEKLPRCVLASIIVVALQKMLLQFTALKKYWKLNKWDALVWTVTFFTTTLVAIDIGLAAGILVSLLAIFVEGYRPYACMLGVVPNTDLYLDMSRYKRVEQVPGIKIFHYTGCVNFVSKAHFRRTLFKHVGFDPSHLLSKRQEMVDGFSVSSEFDELLAMRCLILDCAALTYMDPSGVDVLRQLIRTYKELNIQVYISACSVPIVETLKKCDTYEGKDTNFIIFPTIHDAVLYAEAVMLKNKII